MLANTIFIISEREGQCYYAFLIIAFENKSCVFEDKSCVFVNNTGCNF